MPKVMEIIEKETKGKSYHTYKYSYDSIGLPSIDYDDDPNKVMKWKDSGETDSPKGAVDLKHLADQLQQLGERPLLKYFLDGSRHVFKVDDIAYNKQVFPVVAGQIGVGCCRRENKRMQKERFYRELVLALPDKANADGWDDAAYFAAKVKKLNESEELMRLGLHFSAILPYATSKAGSPGTKLENLAVGVIQDYMVEAEKRMVAELVRDKRLGQDAYLLKDGSLEYKIMKSGREDLRTLQKIKHNYSWVIGVSKSFNPESCLDHTGKPNSNYIANLPVFHRTPVARYENREFLGDVQFGVWYIRLRDKRRTQTPFDGVVKVEKIMMDEEIEAGINSDVIDLISANIINERNPTCYGTDRRWANHLYPVFLTESYVKSKYTTKLKEQSGAALKNYDEISRLEFKDFRDNSGNLIAWMWIGLSRFEKQIPSINHMRGLRVRSANIQLGNDDALQPLFKENRGNYYFVGEVFAASRNLIPNSQRNYFNENETRVLFEDLLREYFFDVLHKLYYEANRVKNDYKRQEEYLSKVAEYQKKEQEKGFVNEEERQKLQFDIDRAKKSAEEARKRLDKLDSSDSASPLSEVRKSIGKKYAADALKKKAETTTVATNDDDKKKPFVTTGMSKLSRSERKLVGKILSIITDIAPKDIAEQIITKIKEEMR